MVDIKEKIQDIDRDSAVSNLSKPARVVGRGISFILKIVFLAAGLVLVFFGGVFAYNLISSGSGGYLAKHGVFEIEKTGATTTVGNSLTDVWNTVWHPEKSSFIQQNSWESDVEQNKDNQDLGVEISSFRTSKNNYESSTPERKVSIDTTATIKAQGLKESDMNFACELEDYKGTISRTPNTETLKIYEGRVNTYNARCSFPDGIENNEKAPIAKKSKLTINYNFLTKAASRFYYMDANTLDSFYQQQKNPFEEYNVNDPSLRSDFTIKSVSTYGPINLGIGNTESQPFIADGQRDYFFNIGLKREFTEGNLKKLNSLKLIVPKEIEIVKDSCEDFKFSESVDNFDYYILKDEKLEDSNKDCSEEALKNTGLTREDCIKDYKDQLVYLCSFKIKEVSPGVLSYAIVRAEADYVYEVQKSTLVDILPKQ